MMKNSRNFARIDVSFRIRLRILTDDDADSMRAELLARPSVWAPNSESLLRDLASGSATGSEGALAQAVLDLAAQVVQLQTRLLDAGGPMRTGTLIQLSGGGGQLTVNEELDFGTFFELRLDDPASGVPPIRAVGQVVHPRGKVPVSYGFRFSAIHPTDQDRLIRFLYQVQRRALREAQES